MKVVLYLRYSSDKQTEQSIEGQKRICTDFCKRMGHDIVGRYVDRATSAFKDTDKRTEFLMMIRDSEKRLWDGVVVYRLDRFARNQYDFAVYERRLNKNGVFVISATENISDTADGVILKAVLRGMAEYYSIELSQKITRGMEDTAKKAHSVGGSIPLGYRIKNKKYVIEESEAQIVREAFEMYAAGTYILDMCRTFNEIGYRSSKGSVFTKNSFHSVL
ncbi:MAG: recombinase family protein, partial [Clostridiales bacterium]|nr:recombinase family protein [Clostridiales bacterium]